MDSKEIWTSRGKISNQREVVLDRRVASSSGNYRVEGWRDWRIATEKKQTALGTKSRDLHLCKCSIVNYFHFSSREFMGRGSFGKKVILLK